MPKLAAEIRVAPSPKTPGRVYLDTPYDEKLIATIKSVPGAEWDRTERMWLFPEEALFVIRATGWKVLEPLRVTNDLNWQVHPDLYDYQRDAFLKFCQKSAGMLEFEMGLGKTPTEIELLKTKRGGSTLIVCPAIVRKVWEDELRKWWRGHPKIQMCDTGAKAKTVRPTDIVITSYELLTHFKNTTGWTDIVFDESHYVKTERAGRSKNARVICNKNPQARKWALTGTPITAEPKDLWHQLELLWPGRFGTYWKFVRAYCNLVDNNYGTEVKGVNEERAEELSERLKACCVRVTKHEVAHLLPPFTVQTIRIKGKRATNPRELSELLGSGVRKQHELNVAVETAGQAKLVQAVELVKEAQAAGQTHICVLTHFRKTAEDIAKKLGGHCVTGDMTVKNRAGVIDMCAKQKSAVLVATMHSVGIGIDLTKFTTAIFAELYWQPAAMVQAIGRFSRLSGRDPATCYLLVLEGSLDEPIASTLKRRLKDQAKLFEAGKSEESLVTGFEKDSEQWADALAEAALQRVEEDPYL